MIKIKQILLLKFLCLLITLFYSSSVLAQTENKERLLKNLETNLIDKNEKERWIIELNNYKRYPDLLNKKNLGYIDLKKDNLKGIYNLFKGIYSRETDVILTYKTLNAAETIFRQQSDTVGIIICLIEKAKLHITNYSDNLGNLQSAKKYTEESLQLSDKLKDPTWQILSYSLASLYYFSMFPADFKNYILIENKKLKLATLYLTNQDPIWGTIYINQANISGYKENIKEQLFYLKKALEIYTPEFPNKKLRLLSLNNIGIAYARLGEKKESLNSFNSVLKETKNSSLSIEKLNTFRNLKSFYELIEPNLTKSKIYTDSAANLTEEILENKKLKLLSELETKYETDRIKQKNLVLSYENKNIRQRYYFSIGIIILLFLLAALYFNGLQKKKRYSKTLETLLIQKDKLEEERKYIWSVIAHDLRQPIHSLVGIGRLLKEYEIKSETNKINQFGGMLEQTVVGLQSNLNNILNYSKLKTQYQVYDPKVLVMGPLMDSILSIYQGFELFGVASFACQGDIKTSIWADKTSMHFILRNLIDNGLKNQTKDKKHIQIRWSNLNSDFLELIVEDSGIGIEMGLLEKINAFLASPHLETDEKLLFGIGLSIIKQHTLKNKIKIWYELRQDAGGTTVMMLIPQKEVTQKD